MVEPSPQEKPEETGSANNPSAPDGMRELRELLLGKDHETMARLQEWLDDPKRRAEDVSRILPDSIALRARRDKKLTRALTPTVEEALTISVKKNPRTIVDAIFPIIGPAIRKAISGALKELVQALNQALEYSLSIKGLRWRLEAMRTGKSFAEVVLSHTLLYRVEQLFLIHRETGLLLHHVAANNALSNVAGPDADLISGMLTAIQDFVRDSFGSQEGETLESLEVGDLDVWIEQGPKAVLAAVIRGNAPQEFRAVLQEAIESIHLHQAEALEAFQGDAAPFEASRPILESCLKTQREEKEKKTSPLLWAAIGILLLAFSIWLILAMRDNWRWQDYLSRLQTEPGIVVVSHETSGGHYHITGLRDPLAADPQEILKRTKIDPADVVSRWESFLSSHPDFVLTRATALLQPPSQVSLHYADGVLSASGLAPQSWIADAQRLSLLIPAVTQFQGDGLTSAEQVGRALAMVKERIETLIIRFDLGSAVITAEQEVLLDNLTSEVKRLDELARFANKKARITISGHTDQTGSEGINLKLEQERARNVLSALTARGISANNLSITSARLLDSRTRQFDRKAAFQVSVTDGGEAER